MTDQTLSHALQMAGRGFKVFPLWGIIEADGKFYDEQTGEIATKEDGSGKRPRGYWKEQATTDPEAIVSWFSEYPNANYGVMLGEGVIVVDCDSSDAADRFDWAFEDLEGAPPDTFTVKTARGFHYYFKGESYTYKLAEDTDLKASGGYVVGPGSLSWAGTRYEVWSCSTDIQEAPEWACKRTRERPSATGQGQPLRIAEGNRNNGMAIVAGALLRQGITHDDVERIILDVINPKYTDIPLDPQELERTVFKSMRDWPIGENLSTQIDRLALLRAQGEWKGSEAYEGRFFEFEEDRKFWEEPTWLIPGMLPTSGIWQLYAPSYLGKTFVVLDLALSICNHTTWFEKEISHHKGRDYVLYILSEGAFDFRQRVESWIAAHPGTDSSKLIVVRQKSLNLAAIDQSQNGWERVINEFNEDSRISALKERIGLVVIDTQSMLLDVEENSNRDMSAAAMVLQDASSLFGCPALLVHHTGKGESRTSRGASSMVAAMDVVITITPSSDDDSVRILKFEKVKGARLPDEEFHFVLTDELEDEAKTALPSAYVLRRDDPLMAMSARVSAEMHKCADYLAANGGSAPQSELRAHCEVPKQGKAYSRFLGELRADPRFNITDTLVNRSPVVELVVPEGGV